MNLMRPLAATLTRYALVALPVGALDTYPRQPGVNIEHYVFALELSDARDEIRGEATVAIRSSKDGLTSFFLDLATPSSGKGFEIAADRAPSDIALDPNTWMLMEPPKFSRRQP